MKRTALFVPLLLATFSWAAPNLDEYSINVHVSSSHWLMAPSVLVGPEPVLRLNVVIDGKKYELEAPTAKANLEAGVTLLAPGDYKAKLVQDQHKNAYESSQAYEFLFPDKKTRKFIVVGQAE
ncbi:MAG TPA: hypothetical protein VN025_15085 [Candidatus Dormibacteraeota bacterium]|nr:hypothetical protein [Candidatus Dormibacteraeota bacterium]